MFEWGSEDVKPTLTLGFRLSCGVTRGQHIQQLLDILTLLDLDEETSFLHKDKTMSWSSTTKEAFDEPGRPSTKAPGPGPSTEKLPLFSAPVQNPAIPVECVECRVNGCMQMNGREFPHQRRGSTSAQPGNKSEG